MESDPIDPRGQSDADALEGVRQYLDRRRSEIDANPQTLNRHAFWNRMVQYLDPDAIALLIILKEMNEERDALTGVLNRRGLVRALDEALEREERMKEPVTLVFMDLDRFKTFNDTYGHTAGDAVLERWVGFLQNGIRKTDSLGRYGGEEVVAILRGATEEQGFVLFDRLRSEITKALEETLGALGIHAPVTMSVGVAQHLPGESAGDLLDRSDARMYEAKEGGRNLVIGGPTTTPKP